MPQGSVLGLQLFLTYTMDLSSILENKLYGYADNSTLVAVLPYPCESEATEESLNRDFNRISELCDLGE